MSHVIPLKDILTEDRPMVGGKAFTLSFLMRDGMDVPDGFCVTVEAYRAFVSESGLGERIHMELERKRFEDMRWEEIWDAALRIRNLFLKTPMPEFLQARIRKGLERGPGQGAVVVRSSAPGEDARSSSFAGLHDSYVNVRGLPSVIESVKKVWASLWSDAALLYRKELGLEVETSAMAVLVQEIIEGDRSGVAFCKDPNDPTRFVIEAVHGLNEGLVDGRVEPDRWVLDRGSGRVLSHTEPQRDVGVFGSESGTRLAPLPEDLSEQPPLSREDTGRVFALAMGAEALLGNPQDVEWTFRGDSLYLLQSRPITTLEEDHGDQRSWYLSLRRSFDNLKELRMRIEEEILPGMREEAERLDAVDPEGLSDEGLASEIHKREEALERWTRVYWDECIPFAHGVRLFGHVYNDAVHPADPFEFIGLLGSSEMLSVGRNQALREMAAMVRGDRSLEDELRKGRKSGFSPAFQEAMDNYLLRFGELSCHEASCTRGMEDVIDLILKLAALPGDRQRQERPDSSLLEKGFFEAFDEKSREEAVELLDLARASYRLRDDDNIYLGRIEALLIRASEAGKKRLGDRFGKEPGVLTPRETAQALADPDFHIPERTAREEAPEVHPVAPRQLVGQPAGAGLSSGRARVVRGPGDLRDLEMGEILVCDAVDPNMTAVVPLANGIVERRGGMLIHGAIIAREYGLPCVTGVPDATTLIETGDVITVDGYLGIVTVDKRPHDPPVRKS